MVGGDQGHGKGDQKTRTIMKGVLIDDGSGLGVKWGLSDLGLGLEMGFG